VSLQQSYHLLQTSMWAHSSTCPLACYHVYVHLKKAGFIVFVEKILDSHVNNTPVFRLWRPERIKQFRKTDPGIPDFYVIVQTCQQPLIPPTTMIAALAPVPVLLCLENSGSLAFFNLSSGASLGDMATRQRR